MEDASSAGPGGKNQYYVRTAAGRKAWLPESYLREAPEDAHKDDGERA